MKISGSFQPTKWDEKPYDVFEDHMKVTKASVEYSYNGEIEGVAAVEYVMFYKSFDPKDQHKAEAQYVGLMRTTGKPRGKAGSFYLIDEGGYESGVA